MAERISEESKLLRKRAGSYLKSLRERGGYTQKELAERTGLQYYTFVSQVESGSARLPVELFKPFAKALNVNSTVLAKNLTKSYEPELFSVLFPGESLTLNLANLEA